ncbi:MAG: biotin--[acetyl-CoA-carboxylase] ligase [Clostridiales bacterium]|jgi:BirA family biotin operon repressor/biotin-[acetyl-CoA-carboxylase] ligase|nr:biotin--[acetyl-CoA-carboxylase] ligase [Clostridiales bacterium]
MLRDTHDAILEEGILRFLGKTYNKFHFYIHDSVSSTNDAAKEMVRSGGAPGSVIVANTQSSGRGRNGRTFSSPEGGIYASFIFAEEQIPYIRQFLSFAPCIAACAVMERLLGVRPSVKWPNDILLNGGKVCGILSETLMGTDISGIIIGIGVNLSTELESLPEEIRLTASTLKQYANNLSRNEFIAGLVRELDNIRASFTKEQYLSEYKKRLTTLGNEIIVISRRGEILAKALDVTEDGGLLIEKTDGVVEKIYEGDISIRNSARQRRKSP